MSTHNAVWISTTCLLTLLLGVLGQSTAVDADLADPGPFGAGLQVVTILRPNGQTFTSQLYYPATTAGDGAPYNGSSAPYPAVTFGHGFTVPPNSYRSTLEHLASHGYLVIAPASYMTFLFPSHQGFAEDFRYSLDFLESENANPASWLFGQVDTAHFGMAGHSMGGGSSILAAAADSRVRALITLAAAETKPSAIAQMPNISAPVRLISGDQDDIVDWQTNTQAMYTVARPPRQLLLIQGGCHCGFLDRNIPFCDSGSLSRAEQLEIARREMVTFFDLYLKPDSDPWREVWGPEQGDDPQVVLQSDPGIDLSPANQTGQGSPGSVVSYSFMVTNLDTQPTGYALMAEDYLWPSAPPPWPASFIPGRTPVLKPSESASVIMHVQLPDTPRPEETILISALSDRDGGTRQFATVTSGADAKDG
jgi:dienelactone hydrolase